MRSRSANVRVITLGILCWIGGLAAAWNPQTLRGDAAEDIRAWAQQILTSSGIQGGVIVHLGCNDGRLTAALGADTRFTVHGLVLDAGHIDLARRQIVEAVDYGRVSVDWLSGDSLPYASNLINLIVAESAGSVSMQELLRVLAPGGVLQRKENDTWQMIVKPRPDEIDEWTHFLHDAGNNAVAQDEVVGPPRALQWVAPPLWLRSHETPSGFQSMVSSGGRVFYFFDEGPIGVTDPRFPERWSLICRDAFNGRMLWKKPLKNWGWPQWAEDRFADKDWTTLRGARTIVPDENQRRLVADGDRLYVTLDYDAPLSILDAATGEVRHTVSETESAREILALEGIVLVHSRDPSAAAARRRGDPGSTPSLLTAVDGTAGTVLWTQQTPSIDNLMLAVDDGRIFFRSGNEMTCLDLASGDRQWSDKTHSGKGKTLIAHGGVVLVYAANNLEARAAQTGKTLWSQSVPPSSGGENPDLFVADGVVWRGMVAIDADLKPVGKSEDAMAVGFDLVTGKEQKRVVVQRLRSPEHHHRCYRNKATERFLISGMEGAEFMDLEGDEHGQHNWLRGACRLGIMPCNGLLYVPPDQCFCQPGAKILGFAAVAGHQPLREQTVSDEQRLQRGPAFPAATASAPEESSEDWPTFRRNPARHGTSPTPVTADLGIRWTTRLPSPLTAPVAADGRVYVAARDAHTVYALDMHSGIPLWNHVAGGRIDSPPTYFEGLLLFGSADGNVTCLRADDGALVWRFLAAPSDLRIGCFDQLESIWPVHGSVLVRDGVAYVTAGRSTYLDGGIRLYGLDPRTGAIRYQNTLTGPMPEVASGRDEAFYLPGANSDVLVAEGEHIYLRQKKLTPDLQELPTDVLSSKGESDVGLHLFSTSGLLDGSWYNRTFWMYSKRWPGFQLANQAPKSGQLLVVDSQHTYGVKVFYRRNVHSPMFFPGEQGYLLFSDDNDNEPQIVGEPGAREPLTWLPQSDYSRGRGNEMRPLNSPAFGLDKMIGYTRAEPPRWTKWLPVRVRAMVKAGDYLFVAGPPDEFRADDPVGALEGRQDARLVALAAHDGAEQADCNLPSPPVFDGLIAAQKCLFVALQDGSLVCLGAAPQEEM